MSGTIRWIRGYASFIVGLAAVAQPGCFADETSSAHSDALSDGPRCIMSRTIAGNGDIAVDRQGDLVVATGPRYRREGLVSIIRKIDANGKEKWVYHVPNGDELLPYGITTDANGAVIVVGRGFHTELLPNGVEDIRNWLFLIKFDARGNLDFRRDFEGGGEFNDVTITPQGDIAVRGRYSSSIDLGGGPMPESYGLATSFIAKFNASGNLLWTKDFGDPDSQAPLGIATDDSGAVIVAGRLMDTFDFGGGPLSPSPNMEAEADLVEDAFLVKYDASGRHVWSKVFGGDGPQRFRNIVMDAAGNAMVLGDNHGVMELGGKRFTEHVELVAAFDPQGEAIFSAALPATWDHSQRIAIAASGDLFIAGSFRGTLDVDGRALLSEGGEDLFVVRLDPQGNVRTGMRFGGVGDDYLWGFAVGPNGDVALAGDFQGALDLGCGRLSAGLKNTAFVTTFTL